MYLKILWKITKSKAGNRYPGITNTEGLNKVNPNRLPKNQIAKNGKSSREDSKRKRKASVCYKWTYIRV